MPQLRYLLDGLPLAWRDDASIWFAEFILQNEQVPAAAMGALADYFQW